MSDYDSQTYPLRPSGRQDAGRLRQLAALPQSSFIVFRALLQTSLVPIVGSSGTFARASSVTYPSTTTALSTATSGNPAMPAFVFNGGLGSGYQTQGTRKNYILQSNVLSHAAWTVVGTLSVQTSIGGSFAFIDGTNGTQLTGSAANSGLIQSSGVACASKAFVASAYVRGTFGTVNGKITVLGTGGTPETTSQAFTTNGTNWTRVYVPVVFTAGATGNANIQLTIDTSTNSIIAGGLQLEYINDSGATGQEVLYPSPYIDTTTVVVATNSDDLFYPSTNFTGAVTKGTSSIWVNTGWIHSDQSPTSSRDKAIFSMNDFDILLGVSGNPSVIDFYYGTGGKAFGPTDTWTRDLWRHYLVAWDNSTGTLNAQLYRDGLQIATNTTLVTVTPALANVAFGSRSSFAFKEYYFDGMLRNPIWWSTKLTAAEALQVFNAERGFFGV